MQQFKLGFEPRAAVFDLESGRHTVAAGIGLAGKTTANRSHVDRTTEFSFGDTKVVLEPFEQHLARGPGKGATSSGFFRSGRLTDQQNSTGYSAPRDRRELHVGTAAARSELNQMTLKFLLQRKHSGSRMDVSYLRRV